MTAGLQSDQQTSVLALAAASVAVCAAVLSGGLPMTREAEAFAPLPARLERDAGAGVAARAESWRYRGLEVAPLDQLERVVAGGGEAEVLVDLGMWVRHRPQAYRVLRVDRKARQVVLRGKAGPLTMSLDAFHDAWRRTGYIAHIEPADG